MALKYNEPLAMTDKLKLKLDRLLSVVDRDWAVSRKQVYEAEFGAFIHLGFTLHVPHSHVHLVYTRLLRLINKSSRAYLGEDMHEVYLQDSQWH